MLRHLDRMREMPEDVTDHPTLDEELCWDEPKPPSTDEVHGSLLMEIGNRPGIRNLQIAVYWNDEHRHFGTFELAVDDETDETCRLSRSRILPASRLIAGLPGPNPAPISMRQFASSSTPFRCSNWKH